MYIFKFFYTPSQQKAKVLLPTGVYNKPVWIYFKMSKRKDVSYSFTSTTIFYVFSIDIYLKKENTTWTDYDIIYFWYKFMNTHEDLFKANKYKFLESRRIAGIRWKVLLIFSKFAKMFFVLLHCWRLVPIIQTNNLQISKVMSFAIVS